MWSGDHRTPVTEYGNAYDQQFEQLLRQLALRWLARNPHLRDTG